MSVLDYVYLQGPGGEQLLLGGDELVLSASVVDLNRAQDGLVQYGREEYRDALAALLPVGMAWPRDPGSALMLLLGALAAELERVGQRAAQLLEEAAPNTAAELLGDWERVVGLPDPCVSTTQTVAQRRAALTGRLTSVGAQSKAFFVELASRLGYTITIDEFTSAGAATAAGISFTGSQWAHIWRVNVTQAVAVTPFRVGSGAVGEPLRAWGNQVLECQFARFKPAHTQVLFAYAT